MYLNEHTFYPMKLAAIPTTPKEPHEPFRFDGHSLEFTVVDFWAWHQSNFIENRTRGILAEFLVRQALGIDNPTRIEWDAYDLITAQGHKIEVKSAAYVQSWAQKQFSSIAFDIQPTKTWLPDNTYSADATRKADVYIFCLLHHQEQETLDPLQLDQWTFYLVLTDTLDQLFPHQKRISLSSLTSIAHRKCTFMELKEQFDKLIA